MRIASRPIKGFLEKKNLSQTIIKNYTNKGVTVGWRARRCA
jgi:hypothetical protein